MEDTKEGKKHQKFLALDFWGHRALKLEELQVTNEEKIEEALKMCQRCLNECRDTFK